MSLQGPLHPRRGKKGPRKLAWQERGKSQELDRHSSSWEGDDNSRRWEGSRHDWQERDDSSSEDQEQWQWSWGHYKEWRAQDWRAQDWYSWSSWWAHNEPAWWSSRSWRWSNDQDWRENYQLDQEAQDETQREGDCEWDKAPEEANDEPQPQEEPQPQIQVAVTRSMLTASASFGSAWAKSGREKAEVALNAVEKYVSSLPRDTFAEWPMSALWKVESMQDGKFRADLQLPPGCPVRRRFSSRPCDTELGARGEAARAALQVLVSRGQVDKDWAQGSVLPPQEPQAAQTDEELTWPLECGGFELGAFASCELSAWPAEWPDGEAHAHVVEGIHGGSRYGFLSCIATHFNYQLSVNGTVLRLEAKPVRWDGQHESIVREFHEMLTYQTGGPIITAVVWLKTSSEQGADGAFDLDLEGMNKVAVGDAPADAPEWLRPVHSRLERLRCLEAQIAGNAPTSPAPSPLKLEAVFGDGQAYRDACEALSVAGEGVLQLMAALSVRAERPWDTARQLHERAQNLLGEQRLAQLLVHSGLPLACGRSLQNARQAATVLKALVGAHYLEADAFAVAKLWRWLCGQDELRPALLHLGGSEPFLGRSETYRELWEGRPEQLKDLLPTVHGGELSELGQEPWLFVYYADFDNAIYRHSGDCGEELRLKSQRTVQLDVLKGPWERVVWQANLGTFCSPTMLSESGQHKPLPNKVTAWLRGRPFGSLARLKKCDNTAPYLDLRETRDGKLHVTFKEIGKKCFFRADDGGLGLEMDVDEAVGKTADKGEQQARVLGFSEENKTLLSLALRKYGPLPNRIAEWVHGARSLAQLAPVRRAAGQEDYKTEGEMACWETGTTKFRCRLEMTDHGGVYLAQCCAGEAKLEDQKWEELVYSEDRKQWEAIGLDGECVPVPHGAVASLARELDEVTSVDSVPARLGKSPWLQAPSASLKFFTHIASLGLAEVEDKLCHTFRNPQLLAEALTHCSMISAASPSLDRLAVLGEAAVLCHVGKQLVKRARFPTAATATHKETDAILASEFAAPKELEHWKALRRRTAGADWLDESLSCGSADLVELNKRKLACCNHVSYARTAIKLGLHKVLQHNSKELGAQIRRFGHMADREADWPALIKCGTPRALGDVFLACVGATVLDSKEANEADRLVEKHIELCRDFQPKQPEHAEFKKVTTLEEIKQALQCNRIRKLALAPKPPSDPGSCSEVSGRYGIQEEQLAVAAVLTDLHRVLVDDASRVGTSPRSAALAAALDALGEAPELSDIADDGSASGAESAGAGRGGEGRTAGAEGAAIHCAICDMWLNGHRQWEDHKSGKKHLKNTRQAQQSGGQKAAGSSKLGAGASSKVEMPSAGGKRREVVQRRASVASSEATTTAPSSTMVAKETLVEEGEAKEKHDTSSVVEELQSTTADSQAAASSLAEARQQHCPGPGYEGQEWFPVPYMQPVVFYPVSPVPGYEYAGDWGYGGFQ